MGVFEEMSFRLWAGKYGVSNPYDPRHHYDYKKAWLAGIQPTKWRDLPWKDRMEDVGQSFMGERGAFSPDTFFWPDLGKKEGHPIKKRKKEKK